MSDPWPLLVGLRQGEIEETAIVDANGEVLVRLSPVGAYEGDLRTAVRRGDFTAQVASAAMAARGLLEACRAAELWISTAPGGEAMRDVMRRAITEAGGACAS